MKKLLKTATVTGLLGLALGASAHAGLEIVFQAPEQYTDIRVPGPGEPAVQVLQPLQAALESWARQLPAGQSLRIEITDIDLAGQLEPVGPSMAWLRVQRDSQWPRIELRYQLKGADGSDLRSGEVTLRDMGYLDAPTSPMAMNTDPLRYEKRMLRQWFEREFVHPAH